jgi:NAD(P)-dependent dehydrogenase (short-subunit alcohol dehydrogenase family)
MREQRSGSIINVASINGLTPGDKQAVYSMTKAAVINMSRAFANECGQYNMRINTLVPGLTKTKFAAALHEDEEFLAPALMRTPLKRSADPNEMAAAVLYLASDASSYTTGSTIIVDGGFIA